MLKERHVEKCTQLILDLIIYLRKLIPADSKTLNKVFSKYRQTDKAEYFEKLLNNLQPAIDLIVKNDEFVFTPEFSARPIYFLIGYDFRQAWQKAKPNADQKKVIFRYLQLIYIQASLSLSKNSEKLKMIVESIRLTDEIDQEAQDNPNMFDEGGFSFQELFGGNNVLMELAKDMSEEMDIMGTLKEIAGSGAFLPGQNPMEVASKLAGNPKVRDMLMDIQGKMSQKMKDKNMNQADLLEAADKLKSNLLDGLGKNVGQMPGGSHIKKMLKNLDINQLMNMCQNMPNSGAGAGAGVGSSDLQSMMSQMMSQMMSGAGAGTGEGSSSSSSSSTSTGTSTANAGGMQDFLQQFQQMQQQLANDPNFSQLMQAFSDKKAEEPLLEEPVD
jgi:hypothetical protein